MLPHFGLLTYCILKDMEVSLPTPQNSIVIFLVHKEHND